MKKTIITALALVLAACTSTKWKESHCKVKCNKSEPYIAPAPTPPSEKFKLSADGLFEFNRYDLGGLQQSGRDSLDLLIKKIKSASVESIVIDGYTDRFGSDEYNAQLSAARAKTVKEYLVSHGVLASIIETHGRGESNPVVVCDGAKSPKVVKCLMPNRRIEVTLHGVK